MNCARPTISTAILIALVAAASVASAQCKDDTDCRAGRVCTNGNCIERACSKDVDCPSNGLCENGVCKTAPAAPPPKEAAPGQPVVPPAPAPQYRTESQRIPALYITGASVLGATWLIGIGITAAAAGSGDPDRGKYIGTAAIPVVGPWLMLSYNGSKNHPFGGHNPGLARAACVTIGLFQAAGLAGLITGLVVKREVQVPVVGSASFAIVPTFGGLAAVGSF